MSQSTEIDKVAISLELGDAWRIAETLGLNYGYVRQVLCGVRHNSDVLELAGLALYDREAFERRRKQLAAARKKGGLQ